MGISSLRLEAESLWIKYGIEENITKDDVRTLMQLQEKARILWI